MSYENKDNTGADGEGSGRELIRKAQKAFNCPERNNAQKTWALMSEFILPSQNTGWFEDTSKGQRRDRRTFDSSAIINNRDLASAMHSTITNPTMKWSKFRFKNEALNDDKEAQAWLQAASSIFHDTLDDSNFDSQMGKDYLSLGGLGNAILYQSEDFKFTAWHLAEVAWAENSDNMVDTIYRKFKMTLKQAHEEFGDEIGEDLVLKLDTDPYSELDFVHAIYPRKKEEVKLNAIGLSTDPKTRPFASCYVMTKGSKIVKEDGHYEFPVYVARWANLPGEIYGFGPGNIALADIRSLNKIKEENLKGLAQAVNPTKIVSKQNMISGDFRPGALTVVRNIDQIKEFVTQSRFDVVAVEVQALQASIKSAFYIDKLLLPPRTETGEMTAYEVAQRLEQMQQILGPVLSRLNTEFLQPFVTRSLKILSREGKIPPIPQSLAAKFPQSKSGQPLVDFEIMFVNSLARSQQLSELRNVQQFIQETGGLAQLKPEVLDNLDEDAILNYNAEIRDIPTNMVRSKEDVKALRDQRQKQQEQQQMMASAEQGSKAIKNIGQAHQAASVGNAAMQQKGK